MNLPVGCGFYSRCKRRIDGLCNRKEAPLMEVSTGHFVRCHLFSLSETEAMK
jgi:peptide/nickel transport system ATP-binding protein